MSIVSCFLALLTLASSETSAQSRRTEQAPPPVKPFEAVFRLDPPQIPDISTSDVIASFGTVTCGVFQDAIVTINNTGTNELYLAPNGVTLPPNFSLVAPDIPPFGIPVQMSRTLRVRWTPVPGQAEIIPPGAVMSIESNDPWHPIWDVALVGQRNYSRIVASTPPPAPLACVHASTPGAIPYTTTGNTAPTFIAFEFESGNDEFTLVSPPIGTVVGGAGVIAFRFAPTLRGPRAGTYRILSGDPGCPDTQRVVLTGTGMTAVAKIEGSPLLFGTTCPTRPVVEEFLVINTGDQTEIVESLSFTGGSPLYSAATPLPSPPLHPGDTLRMQVQFLPGPGDIGPFPADYAVTLRTDPRGCTESFPVHFDGTSIETLLKVNPQPVDFGGLLVGSTADRSLTVTNLGRTAVYITSIRLFGTPSTVTKTGAPALPRLLGTGESFTFDIHFAPTTPEVLAGFIQIGYGYPCNDTSVTPILGEAIVSPQIVVPKELDLGVQPCPTPLHGSLVIRNTGEGTLQVTSMKFSGADSGYFHVVDPVPPFIIAKGDSEVVTVEFDAPVTGPFTADLTIEQNDPRTTYQSVVVVRAERQNRVKWVVEGDTATVMQSCIGAAAMRRFIVRNTGSMSITVDTIAVTTGTSVFTVSGAAFPTTIAIGDSLGFFVTSTPNAAGIFAGSVAVRATPCSLLRMLRLMCAGIVSRPVVVPPAVDFGTVQAGGFGQKTVTVSNPGALAMRVARITIRPPTAAMSLVGAPATPFDIPGGGLATFNVRFAPNVVGPETAMVCIETSAPCVDSTCVDLVGDARSGGLALNRGAMDFALDPCTLDPVCDTVRITNYAPVPVTVNDCSISQASSRRNFVMQPPIATPFTLPPMGSVLLTICALPPFTGAVTGRLVVRSTDGMNPVLEQILTATRDSSRIAATEQAIDFGELAHCMPIRDTIVTIRNTGTLVDTLLESGPLAAPFSLVTPLPLTLDTNAAMRVTIRFAPAADGEFSDTLWLASSRCGARIPVVCRGSYFGQSASVMPDRLTFTGVSVGSSLVRNAVFSNLHRARVNVARVVIIPPGMFMGETAMPAALDSGARVTLGFRFTPVVKGAAQATALVLLDAPCPDTLVIALDGTGVDNGLVFRAPQLVFGALAQCETEDRADTLVNTGSGPFTLTGSTLTGPGAARYTILDPVTTNETLAGGAMRVFTLRFAPGAGADGILDATLAVATTDPLQPVLDVPLTGERRMQRTPPDETRDAGIVWPGNSRTTFVTLTNTGAVPVTYTAANVPPNVTIRPAVPFTVPANDSVVVEVAVTPTAAGRFSFVTTLIAGSPCGDSTRITVTGKGGESFHQTFRAFDVTPRCASARTTVTFYNSDVEDVEIRAITLAGIDSSNFTIVSPTALPIALAPNDTVTITLEFRPMAGKSVYSAFCVTEARVDTHRVVLRSPIFASSVDTLLTAALPLDAGQGQVGTPVTATFAITNPSPFPITVSDAALAAMTVRSTAPALPATIPPGGTLLLDVEWTPRAEGATTDSLALRTTAPCDERATFAVEGRGLPGGIVTTALAVPALEGRVDDHVLIPVTSSADLGAAGTTSWTGALRFNRTMLWPLGVVKEGTLSADMNVAMNYDHTTGTATLTGDGAALRAGAGPLVAIEALVLIGNDVATPVAINPAFDFTSGRARVVARQNGEFHLVGYCLGEGNRLIRIDGAYALEQNRPNPFNPVTEISYTIAMDGMVRLAVYDAWGRDVATLVDAPQAAGRHTARFDARALPSGVYYYRLVSGRFMETRKMVVSK